MKTRNTLAALLLLSLISAHAQAQGIAIYRGGVSQFYATSDIDSIIVLEETPEEIVPLYRQYVDLGLTSGTRWGACNIGANSPEQYGKYYAWGELMEKEEYKSSNYSFTYAEETKRRLSMEEDVAYRTLGKGWRMPTREQFQELMDECAWSWEKYKGVQGCRITGPTGNSIFLPAGTFKASNFDWIPDTAKYGSYWGRERDIYYPIDPNGFPSATELTFGVINLREPAINGNFYYEFGVCGNCCSGRSVRPVYEEFIKAAGLPLSHKWSGERYMAMTISYDSGFDYGTDGEKNPNYNQIVGIPAMDANSRQWYDIDYEITDNSSSWQEIQAPFDNWCEHFGDIYIRREFYFGEQLPERLFLACGHDDAPCEYYLNGELIWSVQDGWKENEVVELDETQIALLRLKEKNVLSFHVHQNWGGMYADCGLYSYNPKK